MTSIQAAFVGIDAGTNGVTVAIFDESGRCLSAVDKGYPCFHPHPGWAEQNMDTVWQAIGEACRAARKKCDVPDSAFRSLGFSSQRGTFALLDELNRPLGPAVLWNDSRAHEMESVLEERVGRERFRAITGMTLSASWAVAKILWIWRNRPDLKDRVRKICNGQEYFLHCLGAEYFETDPASLTLNGMLDIVRLDWSPEVCAAAEIPLDLLPPVGRPGTLVGHLSAAAAEATDFPEGLPLCRGAGDQQCAAIGAGVIKQGMAEITVGTSAMMVAHLEHPDLLLGSAPYIGGHGVPGKWDAEGGAFSIGSCLEWWRRELGHAETSGANLEDGEDWDRIMSLAEEAPAGARGLVFHPFFAGQVTPYYDTSARGAFLGLGLDHTRACLIRAILEGCAAEMRLMVDAFDKDLEGGIVELRITGGGTKSQVFTQIQADIIGRSLRVPADQECTVLGAAILGAVGTGCFNSIEEAVNKMVRVSREIDPDPAVRGLYDELYGIFKAAYESAAASGFYRKLYDFCRSYF